MKRYLSALLLLVITPGLYAQSQYLVTIADLKRLAQYADYTSFGSEVTRWNFTYKGERKGKIDGLTGMQYRYVRPHPNPLFAEATASYWLLNDNSHRVVLTSDNKDWITGLETVIRQSGFTPLDRKGDDKQFVQKEANLIWYLTWKVPFLFADTSPHTLTLYSRINPDAQPTGPATAQPIYPAVATGPTSSELPQLGGDWDANYPPQNAADLFLAERRYAANYEQRHGKAGKVFSHCEKVRIQAVSKGQYRPLTTDRWDRNFDSALRHTGFAAFADNHTKLYQQEALFNIAGELVWMPIQEVVIKTLEKEARAGEAITLYAVLVSHHDFGGTLHRSFLINEFAVASTTDSFDPKPALTQPKTELVQPPLPTKPTATIPAPNPPTKASGSEDFKTFIQRFSTDKAFQLSRVKFPLVWEEYANGGNVPRRDTKDNWKHINVLKESAIDYKVFIQYPTLKKPHEATVSETCRGGDCGYGAGFNFRQIGGVWYCISRYLDSD